jgi:hypothetical protein
MVEVGNGVSLRLIEAGKRGDAPALVFIPGWSTSGDIWRHQIDTFAKTHRVPRQVAKIRQKKISLLDKTDMAHSHLAATVFRAKNQIY